MLPDEPTDEEREEELPEDNGTPFRPADDSAGGPHTLPTANPSPALDDTHPQTDTNLQPEEEYDEGLSGAAEVEDPERTGPRPSAFPLDPEDEN